MNQRRIALLVKTILEETVDPETYDGEWVDWNPEALKEEISLRLDYLVDKGAILKYYLENVVGGLEPSADVFIVPTMAPDKIKLSVSLSKEINEIL